MRISLSKTFEKDYKKLPTKVQKLVDQQLLILLENYKYPSLRIKKMQGQSNIWEGRVTQTYRFTFEKRDDTYILRRVGTHPVLSNP